jgi:hypothetical protein
MLNRSKAQALALLVAVLVVGGAAGWGLETWVHRPRPRGPDAFVNYLTGELKLDSLQRDSVRAVLVRHKPQMDSIWKDVHARVDSLRLVMRKEIFTHLTDAQRTRYLQLVAEQAHQRNDSTRDTTRGGRR